MSALVEVPLESGGSIVVEMDEDVGGVVRAGRAGEVVARAARSIESALDCVAPAAEAVLSKVREARPSEVTVEFGLKLSAEAGAVISRSAGECNFRVVLRWAIPPTDPAAGDGSA
jgi:hypothetical protein